MAEGDQEQDKSEDATPHKLRKAREQGNVARGMDLPFAALLAVLGGVALGFGPDFVQDLGQSFRNAMAAGMTGAREPGIALAVIEPASRSALAGVFGLASAVAAAVLIVQIAQLRGFFITAKPLNPDFSRLNPAKGLKRLFSMRMLKETLKTLLKFALYAAITLWTLSWLVERLGPSLSDAGDLAAGMAAIAFRLLWAFLLAAILFAIIDQLVVRQDYAKQMRMSRRELRREHKDHEGDPLIRQKRKQLHADYTKQNQQASGLAGSDVLIVNPTHYAVSLRYRPARDGAPQITAKGRNGFAAHMRSQALRLAIPIVNDPPLARALHRAGEPGSAIPGTQFERVADIYLKLMRAGYLQMDLKPQ